MVSLFPDLFIYSFLATGVFRMVVGLVFVRIAYSKYFEHRADSVMFFEKLKLRPARTFFLIAVAIEALAGLSLMVGYGTQVSAFVLGTLMALAALIKHNKPSSLPHNTTEFYILLAATSFVFAFIGPGALAFDLPL